MSREIKLGTAVSHPGTIQYGRWSAFTHATGHDEFLPVILAQGRADGPCIWLTAGIHGTEHAGPWVLYELLTQELVDRLKGTIIALPALCPVGLRTSKYVPYVVDKNPNRLWPDGKPAQPPDPEKRPPSALEQAYAHLFEQIRETADFLIDYHNAWTGSISFAFRDRVLYRADQNREENQAEAEALAARLDAMLRAYGHTIVNEFPAERYIDDEFHRSTSGAALLLGRIPAFTVELGTGLTPDRAIVRASVAGTRNVLRWAGMLDDAPEPIEGVKLVDPGFAVHRTTALRAATACVALHRVEAGELVREGDAVAELRDVWGRPLPDSPLRARRDGFVMGRGYGIYYAPGDTVLFLAIRDEHPLVGPYPEKFFQVPKNEKLS
jgi:uncharacterized protein